MGCVPFQPTAMVSDRHFVLVKHSKFVLRSTDIFQFTLTLGVWFLSSLLWCGWFSSRLPTLNGPWWTLSFSSSSLSPGGSDNENSGFALVQ